MNDAGRPVFKVTPPSVIYLWKCTTENGATEHARRQPMTRCLTFNHLHIRKQLLEILMDTSLQSPVRREAVCGVGGGCSHR